MMFKKYVLAVLLAAGFSATAMAQESCCRDPNRSDVQIYGRVDVGYIGSNSVQNSSGQTVGISQISSSPMYTSHLGFIAREKLNGQTEIYARIEGQINPADGSSGISSSSGSANSQFGRETNIGIVNKDIGTFIIGRQVNSVYQYFNHQDVRGGFAFGSSLIYQSDGSSFGGTSTAKTGISSYTGGAYLSNTVTWQTPTKAGFTGRFMYSAGNTAGDVDNNTKMGLAVSYDKGMWLGTTGYYNAYNSTGGITGRYYWLGGGVRPINGLTVRGGYTIFENPMTKDTMAANSQWALSQISSEYQFTPTVKGWAGYYQMNDKISSANKNNMKSVGAEYAFSKRTQVYTAVSFVTNEGTAGWAGYGGGGANYASLNTTAFASTVGQGKSQTSTTVGMVHRF
jgi:predicted porin